MRKPRAITAQGFGLARQRLGALLGLLCSADRTFELPQCPFEAVESFIQFLSARHQSLCEDKRICLLKIARIIGGTWPKCNAASKMRLTIHN
jgi:hypothetical protein